MEDMGEPVFCSQSFISSIRSLVPCILAISLRPSHYTPRTVPCAVFMHHPTSRKLVAFS